MYVVVNPGPHSHFVSMVKAKKGKIISHDGKITLPEVINNLNMSLALPHLDYCCSVWDLSGKKHIESLGEVQRFAHRVMTKE